MPLDSHVRLFRENCLLREADVKLLRVAVSAATYAFVVLALFFIKKKIIMWVGNLCVGWLV